MSVTLALLRRVAGWFTHPLLPACGVFLLVFTLLPLYFPLLLLAYHRYSHRALIAVRIYAGACIMVCTCVNSSYTRSVVAHTTTVRSHIHVVSRTMWTTMWQKDRVLFIIEV